MAMSEKETRLKLIDPKLRRAGWTVLTDKHIIEKYLIKRIIMILI